MVGVLLVDRDVAVVPVDLAEGLGDQCLERLPGRAVGGLDGVVPVQQLGQEGVEDLVDHRLLGVEVVVEAAREHAGGVGDLADGGGVVALLGEQPRRRCRGVRGGGLGGQAAAASWWHVPLSARHVS